MDRIIKRFRERLAERLAMIDSFYWLVSEPVGLVHAGELYIGPCPEGLDPSLTYQEAVPMIGAALDSMAEDMAARARWSIRSWETKGGKIISAELEDKALDSLINAWPLVYYDVKSPHWYIWNKLFYTAEGTLPFGVPPEVIKNFNASENRQGPMYAPGEAMLLLSAVDPQIPARHVNSLLWSLCRGEDPRQPHQDTARKVLGLDADKDELARNALDNPAHGLDPLARELMRELGRLRAAVKMEDASFLKDTASIMESTGDPPMLVFDERAACYLESLGEEGREQAENLRTNARKRWELYSNDLPGRVWSWWTDPDVGIGHHAMPKVGVALAWVLWHDRVKLNLHKIQSLTRPVVKVIAEVSSKKAIVEPTDKGFEVICEGREAIARFNEALGEVPVADYQATLRLAQAGAAKLRSLTCAQFLIWLTARICDQWAEGLEPGRIHIDGAWTGLAREVGLASKKAPTDLRQICAALRCLDFQAPDGSTGALLTYREKRASGQSPGWLKITALEPLCPVYANRRKGDNLLVPILALPPLFGSPRIHGQLANLWLRFELELVNGSIELSRTGGIRLPPDRWVELGSQAGLPECRAMEARDRWADGDKPAIIMIAPDRFTLGDMHAEAKSHLIRQGLARARARQAGRAGSKSRWKGSNRRRKK